MSFDPFVVLEEFAIVALEILNALNWDAPGTTHYATAGTLLQPMPPLVIPAAPKPSAQIPSSLGAQKAAAPKVGGRSGLVGKVLVPLAPPSKRVGHKVADGCDLGEEAQKELDDLSDALF